MRLVLAILALVALSVGAQAGVMCSTYGNITTCTSDDGQQATCFRFGNQVICN